MFNEMFVKCKYVHCINHIPNWAREIYAVKPVPMNNILVSVKL